MEDVVMNILMVTNTYMPHVGGVAQSVATFAEEYRRRGHRVLIVAPEFASLPAQEHDVIRVPAIQNFNGSDFSAVLLPPRNLAETVDAFRPDLIHSHHPFLLGTTAVRLARSRGLPLVFTHHTLYERYTHYVPGDPPALKRFVVRLSTNYANLCATVFAPSESIRALLRERGVTTPIVVVPTGSRLEANTGNGSDFRTAVGIPSDATVIGHVGRLAEEKNLVFLARSIASYLAATPTAHALIVGDGPSRQTMEEIFRNAGIDRVYFSGVLQSSRLVSAYKAMDVFAFSSLSETQGLVLAEAMAAGVPVVALDAPGAREVVEDKVNGRLLYGADETAFHDALAWVVNRPTLEREAMQQAIRRTAEAFSVRVTAARALEAYQILIQNPVASSTKDEDAWRRTKRRLHAEWDIATAAMTAAAGTPEPIEGG
jgi:1,2-diacylglycerol 3-alpha-glucosyltransferase